MEALRLKTYALRRSHVIGTLFIVACSVICISVLIGDSGDAKTLLVFDADAKPGADGCVTDIANQFVETNVAFIEDADTMNQALRSVIIHGTIFVDRVIEFPCGSETCHNVKRIRLPLWKYPHQHNLQCLATGGSATCDVAFSNDSNAAPYGQLRFGMRFSKVDWYSNPRGCIRAEFVSYDQGYIRNYWVAYGFRSISTTNTVCTKTVQLLPSGAVPNDPKTISSLMEISPSLSVNVSSSDPAISQFNDQFMTGAKMTMFWSQDLLVPTLERQSFGGICEREYRLSAADRVGIAFGYLGIITTVCIFVTKRVLMVCDPAAFEEQKSGREPMHPLSQELTTSLLPATENVHPL